ncbi:MAG: hypothetical protein IKZ53_00525 [Selenomonadaceae bacterium]|nr:hypothetical protein [Selenomonadaceae bacterium]
MEVADYSFSDLFSDLFSLPPLDVIIGLICVLIFGITLGALLYMPVAHRSSKLPLEKLSGELIWRYTPDWLIMIVGCIIFLTVSFFMVSGYLREI